jgi:hypothetical protein
LLRPFMWIISTNFQILFACSVLRKPARGCLIQTHNMHVYVYCAFYAQTVSSMHSQIFTTAGWVSLYPCW